MGDELSQEAIGRRRAQRIEHAEQTEQTDSILSSNQSQVQAPSTSYPETLLGSTRLGGRGNGPARTAMIQNAQSTYGNRAVQRLLRKNGSSQVSVQRDDGSGSSGIVGDIIGGLTGAVGAGSEGGIIGGIIAGINAATGPAPNESVRAMYNSGVSDQISGAAMHLQSNDGEPSKEELAKADEEVKSARRVNRTVFESFPEDDKHAYMIARMKLLNNKLVTLTSDIEPLLGNFIPTQDIEQIVEMDAGRAEELEDLVASGGKEPASMGGLGGILGGIGGLGPFGPSGGPASGQPGPVPMPNVGGAPGSPGAVPMPKVGDDPSATPAPSVTPQAGGGNPLARTLWQSTVVAPLKEAAADLKGRPTHAKMERALDKLMDASFGVMSVSGTFPKNSVAQVRMDTFLERLYAVRAQLYAHLETKKKHQAEPQAGMGGFGMAPFPKFMLVPWLADEAREIAEMVARA